MIKLEQRPALYFADFVVYPLIIVGGTVSLIRLDSGHALSLLGHAGAGFLAWTLIEYILHRFLFHHVQPFKTWHDEHHRRPLALIGTPTPVSLVLFVVLAFLPLNYALGVWPALASTLGLIAGYLLYVLVHHAVHHWKTRPGSWLHARKQDHARHHMAGISGWYGVITPFWDRIFFTARKR